MTALIHLSMIHAVAWVHPQRPFTTQLSIHICNTGLKDDQEIVSLLAHVDKDQPLLILFFSGHELSRVA